MTTKNAAEAMEEVLTAAKNLAKWMTARAGQPAESFALKRALKRYEPYADRVAEVERDAARLNWLEQHDGEFYNIDRITAILGIGFNRQPNLRAAIDVAIKQEQADATKPWFDPNSHGRGGI